MLKNMGAVSENVLEVSKYGRMTLFIYLKTYIFVVKTGHLKVKQNILLMELKLYWRRRECIWDIRASQELAVS